MSLGARRPWRNLAPVTPREGLTHREPTIDEEDFRRFVEALEPLMCAGRDVSWALAGRTQANVDKVLKILRKGLALYVILGCGIVNPFLQQIDSFNSSESITDLATLLSIAIRCVLIYLSANKLFLQPVN